MSLTSYRAAPPRVGGLCIDGCIGRPGGDLLSHVLRRSTMGAGGFHGRVRDGIGCSLPAIATRSSNAPCVLFLGSQDWRHVPQPAPISWGLGSGCSGSGKCVCTSFIELCALHPVGARCANGEWMIAAHDGKS